MGESRKGRRTFADEVLNGLDRLANERDMEFVEAGARKAIAGSFFAVIVVRGAHAGNAARIASVMGRLSDGIRRADRFEMSGLPLWLDGDDAVSTPGATRGEFVALRRFMDDLDGDAWLEFDVGPVRKGILLSKQPGDDLQVWDVAGFPELRAIAAYPYATALRAGPVGYVAREAHDPVGAYMPMALQEAEAAGIEVTDPRTLLAMMTREADMAAIACAGMGFGSSRAVKVPGTRRTTVVLGRDAAHDLSRAAEGFAPWPAGLAVQ